MPHSQTSHFHKRYLLRLTRSAEVEWWKRNRKFWNPFPRDRCRPCTAAPWGACTAIVLLSGCLLLPTISYPASVSPRSDQLIESPIVDQVTRPRDDCAAARRRRVSCFTYFIIAWCYRYWLVSRLIVTESAPLMFMTALCSCASFCNLKAR